MNFSFLLVKTFDWILLWWTKHFCRAAIVFYMGKNTPDRQEFIIKNLKELDVAEAV
jgi:hypothetical protein